MVMVVKVNVAYVSTQWPFYDHKQSHDINKAAD